MKMKISLDTPQLIGLNTLISCHGRWQALAAYHNNCKRAALPPTPWAERYLELYAQYAKPSRDHYIDVAAAQKALAEALK